LCIGNDIHSKNRAGSGLLVWQVGVIKVELFTVDETLKFHFSGIGRKLNLLNEPVSDKTRQAAMETLIQSELRHPINPS
jgi:hypothetical protein